MTGEMAAAWGQEVNRLTGAVRRISKIIDDVKKAIDDYSQLYQETINDVEDLQEEWDQQIRAFKLIDVHGEGATDVDKNGIPTRKALEKIKGKGYLDRLGTDPYFSTAGAAKITPRQMVNLGRKIDEQIQKLLGTPPTCVKRYTAIGSPQGFDCSFLSILFPFP